MRNDIQAFLAEAGEAGCYAICLINVAEEFLVKEIDVSEGLLLGVDTGSIYYNAADKEDSNNFFVDSPEKFLESMTNTKWSVVKRPADYVALPNEFVINRWERIKTGAVIGHFDRDNFHPLKHSVTVERGSIVSKRVCKEIV